MTHEEVRALLAMSAAGSLDAAGERTVREHARDCAECAAALQTFSELAGILANRPSPVPPPALLLVTQARVAAALEIAAERRRSVWIAAAAAALAWVINLATYALIHWWRPEVSPALAWLALSAVTASVAAPAAAIVAQKRRMQRRMS
jgi:hypothetical protein